MYYKFKAHHFTHDQFWIFVFILAVFLRFEWKEGWGVVCVTGHDKFYGLCWAAFALPLVGCVFLKGRESGGVSALQHQNN